MLEKVVELRCIRRESSLRNYVVVVFVLVVGYMYLGLIGVVCLMIFIMRFVGSVLRLCLLFLCLSFLCVNKNARVASLKAS